MRRLYDAFLLDDEAVVLRLSIFVEVKNGVFNVLAEIQIAGGGD
jgi:hypothetical protein